jgi:nucleoside-diphosphate-sugar epimerase
MAQNTILVVGASGVVGQAALAHFASLAGWNVVALSRRPPDVSEHRSFKHLAVDLRDRDACHAALSSQSEVTHIIYAALYEKPGLIGGWREADQMQTNLAMLQNLLQPLTEHNRGLRHVSLLQGTKAYGVHLHPLAVPARENSPRDPHDNFYWLQEDFLRAKAAEGGFAFTLFRPQIIFGDAIGVAMNLIPIIGVYAAICREEGRSFAFPGGPDYLLEAVDARLLARAFEWAALAPAARDETFNIANGDVFVWRNVWPAIADALGVTMGADRPLALAEFLPARSDVWDKVVARHGLRPLKLADILGESHHYADYCFAHSARRDPKPVLVSTVKLRQAGFADCNDTEDMFRHWFGVLIEKRILPPRG